MRIIAGTARSMPLKTIEGKDTRPTTDRIKETLFNIIQMEVPGSVFLDLFAGSGAIGLEAVSRGAKKAVFVENSKKAAACIQENIRFTKFTSSCDLKCMDALSALRMLERRYVFDIIFMDPPYEQGLEYDALAHLKDSSILNEDTLIIVEESLETDPYEMEKYGFEITRVKKYKTNQHVFLRRIQ
ncbi:16S rRNA (guanine(966)-N(2))-methyltransferase RsmD [uncultured Eubacterium sp.]|uniref:16S rRNA (guanine(966)-N(2))-methyltransferase RsmD n=1 Tax=uncultured Eubacterium sp. TaxID=165185 RepID=UPI0025E925A7|nr:16S rRNA (guanine(966)-N(2))-methyltransferase RsmD [uncultured Eubacterium sp.]